MAFSELCSGTTDATFLEESQDTTARAKKSIFFIAMEVNCKKAPIGFFSVQHFIKGKFSEYKTMLYKTMLYKTD
jgi:hypothetical protein